jgi:D-alanyl-D-alanine dipeptidase
MIGALLALALAPGFVALEDVDDTILQDMRYATKYNFVGRRIDGYREPVCILHRRAAKALKRVQAAVSERGYTLKVYDCYRPQRAVDHFVRWSENGSQRMKREFYPRVDKSRVFDLGYIARRSGHSRGSTVDLTLVRLPVTPQPRWSREEFGLVRCTAPRRRRFPDNAINMGTSYDCFDTRSHTFNSKGQIRENRLLLRREMDRAGFAPYDNEWWHFTLRNERHPDRYFDFPVASPADPAGRRSRAPGSRAPGRASR